MIWWKRSKCLSRSFKFLNSISQRISKQVFFKGFVYLFFCKLALFESPFLSFLERTYISCHAFSEKKLILWHYYIQNLQNRIKELKWRRTRVIQEWIIRNLWKVYSPPIINIFDKTFFCRWVIVLLYYLFYC